MFVTAILGYHNDRTGSRSASAHQAASIARGMMDVSVSESTIYLEHFEIRLSDEASQKPLIITSWTLPCCSGDVHAILQGQNRMLASLIGPTGFLVTRGDGQTAIPKQPWVAYVPCGSRLTGMWQNSTGHPGCFAASSVFFFLGLSG